MNAPSSSSSIDAATTTVEAATAIAAVLRTVALDQKFKTTTTELFSTASSEIAISA